MKMMIEMVVLQLVVKMKKLIMVKIKMIYMIFILEVKEKMEIKILKQ